MAGADRAGVRRRVLHGRWLGWDHFEDAGLLVGWVGQAFVGSYLDRQVVDLSQQQSTVAVDADTGAVVWHERGTTPLCTANFNLPTVEEESDVPAVRCRYAGQLTAGINRDPTYRDVDVVLAGFDVRTGQTTWQLPMGAARALVYDGGLGDVAGADELMMPAPGGPVIIDLSTGQRRAPTARDVVACVLPTVHFEYDDPYLVGEPITERYGGTLIQWCGGDRRPYAGVPPPDLLAAVGVTRR